MANMEYWIYLNGVPFSVDVEGKELAYGDRLHEPISLNDLKDEGQSYYVMLNKQDNSLSRGLLNDGGKNEHITKVVIPKVIFEEFWNSDEEINSINLASYERDWNITVVNQPLFDLLNGNNPIIDIAGTEFVVNLRYRELQKKGDWDIRINLDQLTKNNQGQYEGYYDLNRQQLCESVNDNKTSKSDIVGVVIPEDSRLDPFVAAPGQGVAAMKFIAGNPMTAKLYATVRPASEMKLLNNIKHLKPKAAPSKGHRPKR